MLAEPLRNAPAAIWNFQTNSILEAPSSLLFPIALPLLQKPVPGIPPLRRLPRLPSRWKLPLPQPQQLLPEPEPSPQRSPSRLLSSPPLPAARSSPVDVVR